ncbi:hypothetical protein M595_0341 [Lyngbya aestuarii BL J]|uniref:Uncharacterized protein n=1 Tax=Lyngbya aestuarii BL J TaxID=1348334 RepID=U7QP16_9CYAN|nr:hypothetical protein [Lyngbya aestuarii]ERT09613.1 hypothetical protein M595_0341 [Lyngbya aestuarii BL J]
MADISKEEMRERLGNIDQIRDILFGGQSREYNNRFEQLESNLSLVQQNLQDRIEQMRIALLSELKTSVDGVEKKIKTLTLSTQEETADLRHQLEGTNRKFAHNIDAIRENLESQTKSMKSEIAQSRDKSQEEIQTLRTQVFEELERRFSHLSEGKVARGEMAEILFEVGMRLKKTEFVPVLKGATEQEVNGDYLLPEGQHQ